MIRGVLGGAIAAALGCAAPDEPRQPPVAAGQSASGSSASASTTQPTVPTVPDQPAREIYIDSVVPGNPLVVMGRARTFENTVQVRVKDAQGALMREVYETSVGEMGNHNPFTARVWLGRDPGREVIIESFEYSAEDGSVRSLTSTTAAIPAPRMEVTVEFATSDCDATRAFTRRVPSTVSVARLLVEILVAGPTAEERAQGASHPFPPGSRVNSAILRGGVLTVDFDHRLRNVGGSCAAQAIRSTVTRTLSRLGSVREVVITAGGSRELALQP